jgi:hypothetical protein
MQERTVMSSSDDDLRPMGVLIDIRDRLPPHAFGDNPTGRLSALIFDIISKDDGHVYEQLAALMLVGRALQKFLREGHGASEEQLKYVVERALEIADNFRIEIDCKNTPKGA